MTEWPDDQSSPSVAYSPRASRRAWSFVEARHRGQGCLREGRKEGGCTGRRLQGFPRWRASGAPPAPAKRGTEREGGTRNFFIQVTLKIKSSRFVSRFCNAFCVATLQNRGDDQRVVTATINALSPRHHPDTTTFAAHVARLLLSRPHGTLTPGAA